MSKDKEVEEKKAEQPKVGETVVLTSKAKQMKAKLDKEDKVAVFVPLSNGEKPGVTQPITLNGYPMHIPKGVHLEVPKTVADVISTKQKREVELQKHPHKIGGDGEVKLTQYGS